MDTEAYLCHSPFKFSGRVVSFSDEVKERVITEDRSYNVKSKKKSSSDPSDFSPLFCTYGRYIDDIEQRRVLIENNRFNCGGKVNDKAQMDSIKTLSMEEKNSYIYKNYMESPNPVKYVSSHILVEGNGIIQHLPQEFILNCISYMMEICSNLEPVGTTVVIDYQNSVIISNRPGKDQRGLLRKKIQYLAEQLE